MWEATLYYSDTVTEKRIRKVRRGFNTQKVAYEAKTTESRYGANRWNSNF